MKYYSFSPNDQSWNNWLLFVEPPEDVPLTVLDDYRDSVCPRCRKFDVDAVFAIGFPYDVRIRGRGDVIHTCDNFFCVDDKVNRLVIKTGVRGIVLSRIGNTGWYALNVTRRVKAKPGTYKNFGGIKRGFCPRCRRALDVAGLVMFERELSELPGQSRLCFTTLIESQRCYRELLLTEDVALLLKDAGVKGGYFRKLLDSDEEVAFKKSVAAGKQRWPPNATIRL